MSVGDTLIHKSQNDFVASLGVHAISQISHNKSVKGAENGNIRNIRVLAVSGELSLHIISNELSRFNINGDS